MRVAISPCCPGSESDSKKANDFSIGIELEGSDHRPFTAAQMRRLRQVVAALQSAFPQITRERVVGHSDIAPGRKTDPGPWFDWGQLWRDG